MKGEAAIAACRMKGGWPSSPQVVPQHLPFVLLKRRHRPSSLGTLY